MTGRAIDLRAADEAEQVALGHALAPCLLWPGVLYLYGALGAGKTSLARGILRGLGHPGSVKSPTYTLIEPYPLGERILYHLDLYRVADPAELEFLGLRDLLGAATLLLVEWPERGFGELPPPDLEIRIQYRPGGGRGLQLRPCSQAGETALERFAIARHSEAHASLE